MDKDTRANLTTLGTGVAAGTAGYGAASAMGSDKGTAITAGAATGLISALLAHLISKKVNHGAPIASPAVAGSASAFTGAATALGTLGGAAYLDDKYGQAVRDFLPNLYKSGQASSNGFVKSLSTTLGNYHNSLNNAITDLGVAKTVGSGRQAHTINPSLTAKIVGKMLRNKKAVAAGLAGVAAMPLTYSLLRGNGSD